MIQTGDNMEHADTMCCLIPNILPFIDNLIYLGMKNVKLIEVCSVK